MAARRRTQEEKNLRTLRELASLLPNKQCFDCHQRGPTYVNVTIGSFVCTSCSGILRGLTPPHRVKSITMTTFTPEEIEYLRSRGNEYCRCVWLGTYDSRTNIETEGRDEHRIREFMVQKYEKKRWYVDPDIAIKKMQQDQQLQQKQIPQVTNSKQQSRVPETQPLSNLLGKTPAPLVVQNNQSSEVWPHPVSSASAPTIMTTKTTSQSQGKSSMDLLSEFGGDIFTAPTSVTGTSTANGNFANFETAFSTPDQPALLPQTSQHNSHHRKAYTPPAGWTSFDDELDPLFSTPASRSSHTVSVTVGSSSHTMPSTAMPRPLSLPTFAPTNPFKSHPFVNLPESSTPSQWPSFPASSSIAASTMTKAVPNNFEAHTPSSYATYDRAAFSPSPVVESATLQQPPSAHPDRYAALADLDSLFNQPATSVTSPSWTVAATTTVTTTTTASIFEFPTTTTMATTNVFAAAPSNPFSAAASRSWTQPPVSNTQNIFSSANPFQTGVESSLPFQQSHVNRVYAPFPIPVVGNSPSDECGRAQFNTGNNNPPFPAFATGDVSSLPNGFPANQFCMQNGGFVTSPTNTWGVSAGVTSTTVTPAWPASHPSHSTGFLMEKVPVETAQYPDWTQNSANPFVGGSGNTGIVSAPRPNPSNPFL